MNNNHKFPFNWNLSNSIFKKDKGTVFSCFSSGGGSTMGYKLAGFDVVGCNEIDPKMMNMYIDNHHPKYSYLESIEYFKNRTDLPEELYNLDILDGSPPCSSFSMSGNRESDWGKEKKFREGQQKQVLDRLFFDFIDVAKKLQPKVVIAENVTGILFGSAKKYVSEIYKQFNLAGYYLQHHVLDSSTMGVPQKRNRVFFIAIRKDLSCKYLKSDQFFESVPILNFSFNEPEIKYKQIRQLSGNKSAFKIGTKTTEFWHQCPAGKSFAYIHPKKSYFNEIKLSPDMVVPTLRATGLPYDYEFPRKLYDVEAILASSFPLDYNFQNNKPSYVVGMSVPPIMMANLATEVYKKILSKLK